MIEFSIKRPVAVFMFCLGIMALGYISITRIPVQMLPEIKTTQVQIISDLRGATPEEMEETVTTPIERNISTVPGILSVSSSSQRESSKILVNLSTKIDQVESQKTQTWVALKKGPADP